MKIIRPEIPLHWKIVVGLVLGTTAGLLMNRLVPNDPSSKAHQQLEWVAQNIAEPIGQIFLRLIFMVVVGVGMMVQMASTNTVIQTIVDDEKRGRVMSFYTMAFLGTAPFGSLLAGALSTRIGAQQTVLLSGVLCLASAFWFARELPAIRRLVRPIYIRMGILPEVATGLQSAASLMTPPEHE